MILLLGLLAYFLGFLQIGVMFFLFPFVFAKPVKGSKR